MKKRLKRQLFHGVLGVIIVWMIYSGTLEKIGKIYPLNKIPLLPSPTSQTLFTVLAIGGALILLSKNYRVPGISWLLNTFEKERNIGSFLFSKRCEMGTRLSSFQPGWERQ